MKPSKPLFMKTYGKQMRKISAWLSPENRKQVFDSSFSTDGDIPVLETSNRLKRQKRLKVSDVTNPVGRLSKRKAMLCLVEKSSNENSSSSSSFESTQKSKTIRHDCPRKKKAKVYKSKTSSDDSVRSPPTLQTAHPRKTSDHLPSVARFVTRRRRIATAKSKNPKASFNLVNSSDDFASEVLGCRSILRPSRRRNVPPAFLASSTENLNISGISSVAANTLKEIPFNVLPHQTLRSHSRKPIFCSTPSAGHFANKPSLKSIAVKDTSDQMGSPQCLSVSCIGVPNPFHRELDSLGQSPPLPAPNLHSDEKLCLSFGEQEPSGDLFVKTKSSNETRSCSEEAKNHSVNTEIQNGENSLRVNLVSPKDLESNIQILSATGEQELLMEALKERCVRVPSTVQLERLYSPTVSQLRSQTTYSSCLGHSIMSNSCQPLGSFNLQLSVTGNKTNASIRSVDTSSQSPSVQYVNTSHNVDGRNGFLMDGQLPANSHQHAVGEAHTSQIKRRCLMMNCSVKMTKQSVAQMNQQSKDSKKEHSNKVVGLEDHTHSGDNSDIMSTSKTVIGPETENSRPLAIRLKEDCLTNNIIVKIKRLSLSQLKGLQSRHGSITKNPEVLDSFSNDQIKDHLQTDDDSHSNEDTCAPRAALKKISLTSPEDVIMWDQDKILLKDSKKVTHNRKKTSIAVRDKKRTTSTDRPGTVRKAHVSGLSVNRWKNKDASKFQVKNTTAHAGSTSSVDCSISEMIPAKSNQTKELLGSTIHFSTPLRVSRLNLSSLLADFTPNTHTWSRIKAVLSVHRKGMVVQTPPSSCQWTLDTPRRATLAKVSQDLFATPSRASTAKRLPSQLLLNSPLVECAKGNLSDAEKVYAECGQRCALPWEECIHPQRMKECLKIGEGTFGEVFSVTSASGETVALKVIPVEGREQVNGEDQKTFGEILHEIIISKELSDLKEKEQNQTNGFIGLNDLHCVQGCYPPEFMEAWDTFDLEKCSENDRPDFFENDQIFIILEFEFGGADLENSNGTLSSVGVAKSILHQVTAALAVAEQELHFEHRDLHWGNVLVKPTKQKKGSFLLNGIEHSVETMGVLVRIIDYSLSRLEIDDLTVSCDISNDEEIFMGQGDYQFDIYRLMRIENGNNWSDYHPHTNVLWLHYLCSKLLLMKYRSSRGKGVKRMKEALTHFSNNVLQYSSATEVLQNCPMFQ
ncbi:uncharacterized protein haspin [Takifugu rubripes]|uniref:Serine/threonine-protein kinase haspin n=1 Tax=Takifugu rubripes TaxID=31033 RepID=A0A3B5JW46_TAKRU|nr:serine/threonine-protein kinase haspin [Takifugu rubripes]